LVADVRGEVEKEGQVLVLRRIHTHYKLRVDTSKRQTVERVHEVHAQNCPVARSIGGSVEISTEVELVK
jgi:uncharacterized OsmC-like protein